jgi:hypothetical protein
MSTAIRANPRSLGNDGLGNVRIGNIPFID